MVFFQSLASWRCTLVCQFVWPCAPLTRCGTPPSSWLTDMLPVLSGSFLVGFRFLTPVSNLFKELWITCNLLQSCHPWTFSLILQATNISEYNKKYLPIALLISSYSYILITSSRCLPSSLGSWLVLGSLVITMIEWEQRNIPAICLMVLNDDNPLISILQWRSCQGAQAEQEALWAGWQVDRAIPAR